MLPLSQWSSGAKIVAGGIITTAAVVAALQALSDYLPVTHPQMMAEFDKRRVVRIQETTEMVSKAVEPLQKELAWVRQDQLTSRIISLTATVSSLQGELVTLTIEDRKNPNNPIIVRRIREVEDTVKGLNEEIASSQCQLDVLRGSGRVCQ